MLRIGWKLSTLPRRLNDLRLRHTVRANPNDTAGTTRVRVACVN
jgi:hypothetical protein